MVMHCVSWSVNMHVRLKPLLLLLLVEELMMISMLTAAVRR